MIDVGQLVSRGRFQNESVAIFCAGSRQAGVAAENQGIDAALMRVMRDLSAGIQLKHADQTL